MALLKDAKICDLRGGFPPWLPPLKSKGENMSATVTYHPVKPGKNLPLMAPQRFISTMKTACFGSEPPWQLSRSSIPALRGMAAVFEPDNLKCKNNPYLILIDELNKHGDLVVEVEY